MAGPTETIDISGMDDAALQAFMKENAISLKTSEIRSLPKKLGREPTITEIHIFNIQWSEHSSYKSSRNVLKQLPTDASNVILGPKEDSGIVELGEIDGERYGIVMSHESHNHPSQVVPFEGAATGVGGILRDVMCMGAKVIGTADPLRFGDPKGKDADRTRYIANSVIDGIAGYGNPVGIPNLGGDVYFNESFDDNCLVNVVCLGVVKESDIIHSYVPQEAKEKEYDVIVVGKATDNSGFGGAAFASLVLDDEEQNKGAVQVPDPFLKNVLIRATYAVFEEVRKKKIQVGFKDMGAGGIMCATSELGSAAGFGMEIDIDKIHTSMDLPPFITLCGETQERFCWVVPKEFTETVLRIYNKDFELPRVAEKARASVVGKIIAEKRYLIRHKGEVVCDAPIDEVTEGIRYDRQSKDPKKVFKEPDLLVPEDYNEILLKVLSDPNVASKEDIYTHYDREVIGNSVIRAGEADASLTIPVSGKSYGVALSVDSNPKYGRISPYWGAANAVAEAMRNVAAIGATPVAITDCLNYGNPEIPEQFWQFCEGVRGVAEAARTIKRKGTNEPVPVISGNVSFYNESSAGKAVDPSAVIGCVGVIEDISQAVTMELKKEGSAIYMLGSRKDELGGSIYYGVRGELGANVPKPDLEDERKRIHAMIDAISSGMVLSCHDISDGGMITAVSEMILGGYAEGNIGAELELNDDERSDVILFSESPGFVFEADLKDERKLEKLFANHKVDMFRIGRAGGGSLVVRHNDSTIISTSIEDMRHAWTSGLRKAIR